MKYLIDTSVCIDVMQRRGQARAKLAKLRREQCCISSVVKAELMVGVHKADDPQCQAKILEAFLAGLTVLPFNETAADAYGKLRAALEAGGAVIGANDMLIAAHALSAKLTLLTSDGHFERVEKLKLKLWKKP